MSTVWLWLCLVQAQEPPVEASVEASVTEPAGEAPPSTVERSEPPVPEVEAPGDGSPEAPVEPLPEAPVEPLPEAPVEAPSEPVLDPADAPAAAPDAPKAPPILQYGPDLPVEEEPEVPVYVPVPSPVPAQPVVVVQPQPESPVGAVMPWVEPRGFFAGLVLLFFAGIFAALSDLFGRARAELADRGLLPTLTAFSSTGSRVLAAFFGLGVIAAWVPANVAPAIPWIMVGVALALGWSAREVLPDLVAWLSLTLEGRVRPGRWVHGEGFRGEVVRVGPRTTVILDERGGELSLPNRRFVHEAYGRDPSVWPKVEVEIGLPEHLDPGRARRAIRQAVLLSPWVARGELEIGAATDGPGRWTVRVRLLEGTYLALFEGSLRERVMEVLEAP